MLSKDASLVVDGYDVPFRTVCSEHISVTADSRHRCSLGSENQVPNERQLVRDPPAPNMVGSRARR
jgi:hypothetical protein